MEDWEKKRIKKMLDDILNNENREPKTTVLEIHCISRQHVEFNVIVCIGGVFEDTTFTV